MANTKVIIVGGGFGGINAALALGQSDVEVTLIDKTNHHLFQPLLYQVASASLSPGDIATPIRQILRKQENTNVLMGQVDRIDKEKREVILHNGEAYDYDYLILAPGARHSYFGHDEWEKYAPGLKSLNDAITIRENVLLAFERAERSGSFAEVQKYLRFVLIGGGPTGVEMAGAIAEIAHETLFHNFRKIKPEHSEIYLIEGEDRVLSHYPPHLSEIARKDLEKMGVKVMTHTRVSKVNEEGVYIGDKLIEAKNVIWAAGNHASPLLKTLEVELDRGGRAQVGSDLSLSDHPEVFVIGDAAHALDEKGAPLPALAPVALQQGKYVAKVIDQKLPKEKRSPFRYYDKGTMATIGRAKAVGQVGKREFSGFFAWLAWCFIHIFYLISFRARFLVMMEWGFWYILGSRHVRLIKRPIFEEERFPKREMKEEKEKDKSLS